MSSAPIGGQPGRERRSIVLVLDRRRSLQQDGTGIEPGFHPHGGDPGLAVTGGDRGLDRSRAPMSRQQRSVQIDAAEARQREQRSRKDLTEGDHHRDVDVERAERLEESRRPSPSRAATPRDRWRARARPPRCPRCDGRARRGAAAGSPPGSVETATRPARRASAARSRVSRRRRLCAAAASAHGIPWRRLEIANRRSLGATPRARRSSPA